MRLVHGRFAAVSVRAAFLAGMWVGLVLGLVIGAILGALLVWLSGTMLDWQRDLGFTLGITRALLPFGDQIAALRWLSATWWAVVPAGALIFGLLGAAVAGSIAALLAAAYNRTPRHAGVLLELTDPRELEASARPVLRLADQEPSAPADRQPSAPAHGGADEPEA
jgi:hypothetical protein